VDVKDDLGGEGGPHPHILSVGCDTTGHINGVTAKSLSPAFIKVKFDFCSSNEQNLFDFCSYLSLLYAITSIFCCFIKLLVLNSVKLLPDMNLQHLIKPVKCGKLTFNLYLHRAVRSKMLGFLMNINI